MGLTLLPILLACIPGGAGAYDVRIFDNSQYVNNVGSANTKAVLDNNDVSWQTFLSLSSTFGWTSDIAIVPDMGEASRLDTDMPDVVKSAIRDKVNSGGLLIVGNAGFSAGRHTCTTCVEAVWLFDVFGWSVERSQPCSSGTWSQTSRARDLPSIQRLTEMQDHSHITAVTTASLPADAIPLYTMGSCTSVSAIPYGLGLVVMVGYDYSARLSDWDDLLVGLLTARNAFGRSTPAAANYCKLDDLNHTCTIYDYCCDHQCTYCGPRLYCQHYSPFYSLGRLCNSVTKEDRCINYHGTCKTADSASQAWPLCRTAVPVLTSLLALLIYV